MCACVPDPSQRQKGGIFIPPSVSTGSLAVQAVCCHSCARGTLSCTSEVHTCRPPAHLSMRCGPAPSGCPSGPRCLFSTGTGPASRSPTSPAPCKQVPDTRSAGRCPTRKLAPWRPSHDHIQFEITNHWKCSQPSWRMDRLQGPRLLQTVQVRHPLANGDEGTKCDTHWQMVTKVQSATPTGKW